MLRRAESNPSRLSSANHSRNRSTSGSDIEQLLTGNVGAQRGGEEIRERSSSLLVGKGQKGHKLRARWTTGQQSAAVPPAANMFTLRLRSPSFRQSAPRKRDATQALLHSPHLSPLPGGVGNNAGSFNIMSSPYSSPMSPRNEDMMIPDSSNSFQKIVESFIYGLVNSILTVPCMYGYAAIIFRASFFQEYMPELAKLVLFSSVIHQCVFTLKSSLSFSIGQVQDAGLIFLSTMATAIAQDASSPEAIVPTTLVTLSIATSMLGAVLYIVGRLRLAKLVSYLPMPVVGGYLAFIGLFCAFAGFGLCMGEDISSIQDVPKLFNSKAIVLCTPALLGGALLAIVSKVSERWYSLPACIIVLPLFFYLYMFLTDMDFEQAREAGWMEKPRQTGAIGPFYEVWNLFDISKVDWYQVPAQVVTWISMTFVVAFSSCLDVVAIEMDMGQELDINHELCTVGLSNIFSGLTGGYSGSYIFSQTIFTFRTGTDSRLVGMVVILSELGLFVAPFNVLEYVPLYFFAATLIFIAFDLIMEWLVVSWYKVSGKEYGVLIGTFLIITGTNDLMLGIFAGVGLAILNFIIAYSSVTHVQVVSKTNSNVSRDFERRRVLARLKPSVARLDLHGYLFFGSSVQIVKKIQMLLLQRQTPQLHNREDQSMTQQQQQQEDAGIESKTFTSKLNSFLSSIFGGADRCDEVRPLINQSGGGGGEYGSENGYTAPRISSDPHLARRLSTAESEESTDRQIQFLILDFTRVTGMDATAISTGLMRVKQIAILNDITVVFTSIRPEFVQLLEVNHIVDTSDPQDFCKIFEEVHDGLEWVENELLKSYGIEGRGSPKMPPRNLEPETPLMPNIPFALNRDGTRNKVVMSLHSEPTATVWLRRILIDFFGFDQTFELSLEDPNLGEYQQLTEYFGLMRFRKGDYIFSLGDPSDALYIVMVGEISLFFPKTESLNKHSGTYWSSKQQDQDIKSGNGGKLLQRARYGCIFGEIHFTLSEVRQFNAIATEDSAVFFLSRSRLQELEKRNPKLALGLFQCLTKFLCLTVSDLQNYQNHQG